MRGNSSVTILALPEDCNDEETLVLVQALAENEGLVTLTLEWVPITDEIGLPRGDRVRTTQHSSILSFQLSVLGETGSRMRRRLSGCKPWWMRFE
jgi:hypothetical protein